MSDMDKAIFDSKKGLPNKLLQEDGTVTDLAGNRVISAVDSYENKPALPNKWLNPDGSYSTLSEIIGGAAGADLFIVVDELPATGEENKIYLISKESGDGFVEWIYADGQWDTIGEYDIDLSNYPTTEQMEQYVDDHAGGEQVFYWDGDTTDLEFWNEIYQLQKTQPCLVYTTYTQNNKSITQHWLYNNNMPTSASETAVSYSVYTPSGTQMIDNSYSQISRYTCQLYFTITDDQVTAISMNIHTPSNINYIDVTGFYSTAFIPSSPSSPATKKYVDDHVGNKQVFYWDGKTDQTGLDFWNEIYQLQKTQPCLVYTEYEKSGNKITQSWHYNNNLPTSTWDVNSTSRWLGDKTTSNSRQNQVMVWSAKLYFDVENNVVINIKYKNDGYREYTYLDTNENYSTPYEPLYPGSPTTKKYVDDAIAAAVEDTLGGSY